MQKLETEKLTATITLASAIVKQPQDLKVVVIIKNNSSDRIRLNTQFMKFAQLMLMVRTFDGSPVYPGPPPIPKIDDGTTGRVDLDFGAIFQIELLGRSYFAQSLAEGRYQVKFRYINQVSEYGDWVGTLESDWADFDITR